MAHGRPRKTAMTGGGRYSVQSKSVRTRQDSRKLVKSQRTQRKAEVAETGPAPAVLRIAALCGGIDGLSQLAWMDAAGAVWAGGPRGGGRTPARHDAPFVQEQDVSLPN